MILRRSNNNGTDVYEEISLEEAIKLNKKEIIFFFFFDKEAYEEAFKTQKKDRKDPLDQFVEGMENFGEKINKVVNDAFKGFSNNRYNEKTRKIKKILPFLDEEDLKEIVEAILAKDE